MTRAIVRRVAMLSRAVALDVAAIVGYATLVVGIGLVSLPLAVAAVGATILGLSVLAAVREEAP